MAIPGVKVEASRPGYFESPFEKYPGHIQFPYPLILPQFEAWWKAAIEPLKSLTRLDWGYSSADWAGAKVLLLDYGEWAIQGVAPGEARERPPLEVVSWVCECAAAYLETQLSEKKMLLLSTVL